MRGFYPIHLSSPLSLSPDYCPGDEAARFPRVSSAVSSSSSSLSLSKELKMLPFTSLQLLRFLHHYYLSPTPSLTQSTSVLTFSLPVSLNLRSCHFLSVDPSLRRPLILTMTQIPLHVLYPQSSSKILTLSR